MSGTVQIVVPRASGELVPVRAFLTPTSGLVVHPDIDDLGWVITHQRSGHAVGLCDDPESAVFIAVELGEHADWTLSGDELRAQEVGTKTKAIRDTCPSPGVSRPAIDRNPV